MSIKFNKDKFKKELEKNFKPSGSYWGLLGIVIFFILPELIALYWGDKIASYTTLAQAEVTSLSQKIWYKFLEMMFTKVSYLNLIVGFGLVYWFYHVRKKSSHDRVD